MEWVLSKLKGVRFHYEPVVSNHFTLVFLLAVQTETEKRIRRFGISEGLLLKGCLCF